MDIVNKALANRPEFRYTNAGEMLSAFRKTTTEITSDKTVDKKHSTIEFLLRRIRRNQDFPALSNNLFTINKLTSDDSDASTEKLASFILRDYSITNKLLRLANSSFYRNFSGKVNSVSRAITILGINQVKMACNSLMLFDKIGKKTNEPYLLDSLIHSFMSGLIARHLASSIYSIDPEEAFICGMFHGLGRTLTIYYFLDEYEEILDTGKELNISNESAAEIILGLKLSEVGQAVAREWQFPEPIIESMEPMENLMLETEENETQQVTPLRRLAIVSNLLADIAHIDSGKEQSYIPVIVLLAKPLIKIDSKYLIALINAVYEKFEQFSPILGLKSGNSAYIAELRKWLALNIPQQQQKQAMSA